MTSASASSDQAPQSLQIFSFDRAAASFAKLGMAAPKWELGEIRVVCRSKKGGLHCMGNPNFTEIDFSGFMEGVYRFLRLEFLDRNFHASRAPGIRNELGKKWNLQGEDGLHKNVATALRLRLSVASLSLSHALKKNGISSTSMQEKKKPAMRDQELDINLIIEPFDVEPSHSSSFQADPATNLLNTSTSFGVVSGPNYPQNNPRRSCRDNKRASEKAGKEIKEFSVFERASTGAAAGAFAGAFTYTCLHPLDTVKTKLQTRGALNLYSGSLDVIMKVLRTEGIVGLYKGISAVMVGSAISSGIYFGACEFGKSLLSKIPAVPSIAIPPLAGAMGNVASSLILVPKYLITQRMQAGAAGRSWEILLQTMKTDGLKGLYVGYSAALLRDLPASVISYSSFEYLQLAWLKSTKKVSLEPWQSVVSGAFAGAVAAALTTPVDVVKTRLMTQTRGLPLGSQFEAQLTAEASVLSYKGILSTLKQIWMEEGWIGITSGLGPRLLHSACLSAIGFFAFETARIYIVKQKLASQRNERD